MRSGELHYIDHPMLGVMVKVVPVNAAPLGFLNTLLGVLILCAFMSFNLGINALKSNVPALNFVPAAHGSPPKRHHGCCTPAAR